MGSCAGFTLAPGRDSGPEWKGTGGDSGGKGFAPGQICLKRIPRFPREPGDPFAVLPQ